MDEDILNLIRRHRLMVRPALAPGNWRAGKWAGVKMDGSAYCVDGSEHEAESLVEAVNMAVAWIVTRSLAPNVI